MLAFYTFRIPAAVKVKDNIIHTGTSGLFVDYGMYYLTCVCRTFAVKCQGVFIVLIVYMFFHHRLLVSYRIAAAVCKIFKAHINASFDK